MADKKKPTRPKVMMPNRNPGSIQPRGNLPKKIIPGTPRVTAKARPGTVGPKKKTPSMPKPKIKKKPIPMPTTKSGEINPFNMTPQQKSDYLRNPGRYSRG